MLKPALLYKDQIMKEFMKVMYTDDYFYYAGYPFAHQLPEIIDRDNVFQYAVMDKFGLVLIGYIQYRKDEYTDSIYSFGMICFDKDSSISFARDLYKLMTDLVQNHHRVEWRAIASNHVVRAYDRFCKKYNGYKHMLHDTLTDNNGILRDEIIYEIINDNK